MALGGALIARSRPRQNDLTAGEWAPDLDGRVDMERYFRSVHRLENFLITESGGATRRPGTRYVATIPGAGRLVRFEFSTTQAYVLCFTDSLLTIFRNNVLLTTLTTTYLASELARIKTTQSADVLIITHPDHAPAKLERLSASTFRLRTITFDVMPAFEYGARPNVTLTPAAVSGNGVSFTLSGSYALAADIGRQIIVTAGASNGAKAKITAVPDATHYTADITESFADLTAVPVGSWKLDASPKTTCTPSAKDPVGATGVTLTLPVGTPGWRSEDVGKFVHLNTGVFEITTFTSSTSVSSTIRSVANAITAGQSGAWQLEEAAWSATNGYPFGTRFSSEDRLYFFSTYAQPQGIWGSKSGNYFNFATGALDDDAIAEVLNTDQVNAIRQIAEGRALALFTVGGEFVVLPADGAVLTPSRFPVKPQTAFGVAETVPVARVGQAILFPTRTRRRLREFVFNFQNDAYLAPDLLRTSRHLTRPKNINGVRTLRGLVDLAYQREPDSTLWAPRDDGVLLALTYVRDENFVGWHRHITGTLASGTVADPDGETIPAAKDGIVTSVATIPHPDGDREQVWLIVQRTVNGAVVYYVEYLDDTGLYYEALYTDATLTFDGVNRTATVTPSAVVGTGLTFTSSVASFTAADVGKDIRVLNKTYRATITAFTDTTHVVGTILADYTWPNTDAVAAGAWGLATNTFAGLAHLEGKTVDILGDGRPYAQRAVSAGTVTFTSTEPKAVQVEIGLPYTSRIITNRPELSTPVGSIQGQPQGWAEIVVRFRRTLGGKINGQPIQTTVAAGNPPQPLDVVDERIGASGVDTEGRITIEQTQPLPMTVLLLTGTLSVGLD